VGGGILASGGTDKTVRIWDSRAPDLFAVATLHGHSKRVDGLQIKDHTLITSSRSASEVKLWDLRALQQNQQNPVKEVKSAGLTVLRVGGDRFATGHTDRCIRIYDARTGDLERTLTGHSDSIHCLQLDRQKLVSGSRDCTVRLWDPTTGREMNRIRFLNRGFPSCLSFNQSKLVLGTSANGVLVYDFSLSKRVEEDTDMLCSSLSGCLPSYSSSGPKRKRASMRVLN
jgi:WD40 repeat protein